MRQVVFLLLVMLCAPLAAQAATYTEFIQVNTGNFDDAGLSGFTTYAMRVTSDTDWTSADLEIDLTSGSIHHIPPSFLGAPDGVNGIGDTAGIAPTNVLGDLTGGFNGTAGYSGTHVETATSFRSSWFNTLTNDIGTFDIAIITLSNDAVGSLGFRTISGADVEELGFGNMGKNHPPCIVDGEIRLLWCPEPGSLALVGIGMVSLLGTLRRK